MRLNRAVQCEGYIFGDLVMKRLAATSIDHRKPEIY